MVWSEPGASTLVHAATNLTAFATTAATSAALGGLRFPRDVTAGNSYLVDDVTVEGQRHQRPGRRFRSGRAPQARWSIYPAM